MDAIGGDKLVECPICKGKVAIDAKTCPHCGHPLKSSKDILKQAGENAKAVVTNPTVSNVAKSTGRILYKILKIIVWLILVGILLNIGVRIPMEAPETVVVWALIYPILFNKPCIVLSKFLIGQSFARWLYHGCSIFYAPSAMVVIFSMKTKENDMQDEICLIIATALSVLWSLHFIHCANAQKLKVALLVWNLVFAIPVVLLIMFT